VKRILTCIVCALAFVVTPSAMLHAQEWQPGPTVEFIVPAGAGAALDSAGREIQQLLRQRDLVRSMVVINKPGGNSAIALAVLDQHPGDGNYLMTLTTSILNSHILGQLPKSYRDYTPLALLFREYIGLVVREDSPFRTAQDLIRFMKDKPGALNIGVATSVGNHIHVGAALPLSKAGVKHHSVQVLWGVHFGAPWRAHRGRRGDHAQPDYGNGFGSPARARGRVSQAAGGRARVDTDVARVGRRRGDLVGAGRSGRAGADARAGPLLGFGAGRNQQVR